MAPDRCPLCLSDQVQHFVVGLLPPGALETAQPWEVLLGCAIPDDYCDRACLACGHRWDLPRSELIILPMTHP